MRLEKIWNRKQISRRKESKFLGGPAGAGMRRVSKALECNREDLFPLSEGIKASE